MLMSCSGISFKELKLIVVAECVIFPWSLIGATMQDGGKRERRNAPVTQLCIMIKDNKKYYKLYLACIFTASRLIFTN